jgi:hypothetical protein
MKATYIWQMINQVGRYFFFLLFFFMAFLCVSQQGEFKNTIKTFWGNPCQKLLAEKVEKKKLFSFHLFPWRFCAFLNKGSSKIP